MDYSIILLLQQQQLKGYLAGESFRAVTKSFSSDTATTNTHFKPEICQT